MPVGIDIAIAFIVGGALGLLIGWLMGRTRAPITPGDSRLENELRQQLTQRETEISATREQLTQTSVRSPGGRLQCGITLGMTPTVKRDHQAVDATSLVTAEVDDYVQYLAHELG